MFNPGLGVNVHWLFEPQNLSNFTDPTNVPGLALWFKADGGTDGVSDADPVSTWTDASGNGRHLTGTTTTRPLYKLAIAPSGLPVVRFDGVDDNLVTSAFAWSQPVTHFVVCQYTAAFDGTHRGISDATSGSYTLLNYRGGSTTMGMYDSGAGLGSSATTPESWHVWTFTHNSTSSFMRAESSQIGTGDPGNPAISGFTLCGTEPASVDIAEVVIYDRVLTESEMVSVENYLNAKWLTVTATTTRLLSLSGVGS